MKNRGQIESAILLFVGLAIFAIVGYALLPTVANASAVTGSVPSSNTTNLTTATLAVNALGPVMVAVAILLAIVSGAFAIYSIFGR